MPSMQIAIMILALGISIILHELAHGFAAYRLGDPTARNKGRLTLNPLAHVDPVGSLLLPAVLIAFQSPVLFGWAKPVPVNPMNFRDHKKGMMLVGLAGPATNILLAVISGVLFRLLPLSTDTGLGKFLVLLCLINVILAILNLLPVPPLDGSRVVAGLIPDHMVQHYMKLQSFGFLIVLGFILIGGFDLIIIPLVRTVQNFLQLQ